MARHPRSAIQAGCGKISPRIKSDTMFGYLATDGISLRAGDLSDAMPIIECERSARIRQTDCIDVRRDWTVLLTRRASRLSFSPLSATFFTSTQRAPHLRGWAC